MNMTRIVEASREAAREAARAAAAGWSPFGGRDRGDVPGWVLITVMTAGLVSALWLVAGPTLLQMFESALSSVRGR